MLTFLVRLYALLVRAYPRLFRSQFGDEMRAVFTEASTEAALRGKRPLWTLCLRELWDWPRALLAQHGSRLVSPSPVQVPKEGGIPTAGDRSTDRPCSWGESLAGLVPFLFLGLWSIVLALLAFPPPPWQLVAYVAPLVAGYVVALVGLGVGWAQGFPRWSYSYVLCIPLFGLYVALSACSAIWPYPHVPCVPLFSALLPLAVVAAVVLVVTRSRRPLDRLVTNVWRDWTRLSFALYGLVPLLVWFAFDEVDDRFVLPFMMALTLILAGGALTYLRSVRTWQRAIALLVGAVLARVVATVGTRVYWNAHPEPWMTGPPTPWYDIVRASVTTSVLLLALLFTPALLGLLRRFVKPARAA
jgi:hypothetical protein